MLLDSIRSYNALSELASLCPTFSATEDMVGADLPESLAVEWSNGVPSLRPNAFDAGQFKIPCTQRPKTWHMLREAHSCAYRG